MQFRILLNIIMCDLNKTAQFVLFLILALQRLKQNSFDSHYRRTVTSSTLACSTVPLTWLTTSLALPTLHSTTTQRGKSLQFRSGAANLFGVRAKLFLKKPRRAFFHHKLKAISWPRGHFKTASRAKKCPWLMGWPPLTWFR